MIEKQKEVGYSNPSPDRRQATNNILYSIMV